MTVFKCNDCDEFFEAEDKPSICPICEETGNIHKCKYQIKTLHDLIHLEEYSIYESESLSLQANIINFEPKPEIITTAQIISSWRYFLNDIVTLNDLPEDTLDSINVEIDQCEKWHMDHNTLDDVVYDYGSDN